MAERIASIERVGPTAWRYTLTGTAPWTLVRAGVSHLVGASPFVDDNPDNSETEPPAWECFDATDDPSTAQSTLYPRQTVIQWRGNAGVLFWSVESYADGVWTQAANVPERGLGYYQWTTPKLDDQATSQWRVVGYDLTGQASAAATVSVFVIGNPDPPAVTMAYAGGTLTIEAAP